MRPALHHLRPHYPQLRSHALRRSRRHEDGALCAEGEGGVGAGEAGVAAGGADQVRMRGAEGVEGTLGEVADAAARREGAKEEESGNQFGSQFEWARERLATLRRGTIGVGLTGI